MATYTVKFRDPIADINTFAHCETIEEALASPVQEHAETTHRIVEIFNDETNIKEYQGGWRKANASADWELYWFDCVARITVKDVAKHIKRVNGIRTKEINKMIAEKQRQMAKLMAEIAELNTVLASM